jgi:hypothetical protein
MVGCQSSDGLPPEKVDCHLCGGRGEPKSIKEKKLLQKLPSNTINASLLSAHNKDKYFIWKAPKTLTLKSPPGTSLNFIFPAIPLLVFLILARLSL